MSEPSAYDPIRYWSELLGERYDDTGVAYPALSESFNQALHRALTRETRRVLDRYGLLDRSPSRVLDVGSGSGIWIRFWTEFGARQIVGVDLTEVAVERLRMGHPQATFLPADVGEPGLSVGGMFDFISAMSVLLRIVDDSRWRRALRNLATVLAPDGHLVVFDPVIVSRRGAERWYRSFAERLAASGHEVTVLTLRQWEPDEQAAQRARPRLCPRGTGNRSGRHGRDLVGSLDERKDPLVAVWAADRARVTLLVVGDGPLRSTVQHAAGANAHVLGRRDDVPACSTPRTSTSRPRTARA